MDGEQVKRFAQLLADYRAQRERAVMVSWLGGEPFLWPALPTLARHLSALNLHQAATTNGLPLRSLALQELVASCFNELTFSIDGLAPWHDKVRARPGLFAEVRSVVRAVHAAAAARGQKLVLKVNTILMRDNVSSFAELCDELQGWGVTELTFNQLGGSDRPEFYPPNRLLPAQVERFAAELPALQDRLQARGLRIHGSSRYLVRLRASSLGERLPVADCSPGSWFLFVDEQGRVGPCSYTLAEHSVPVTSLHTPADLDALPARFTMLRKAVPAAACGDCQSTQVFDKFS